MRKKSLYKLTLTALFSACLAVSAQIYIPLTVPVTLQTLVLFSSLLLIGGRLTSIAVAVYLALGAVGLPVFSGFSGGVGRLLEPSGGFLLGMLLASLLYWLLAGKRSGAKRKLLSSLLSLILLYAVGASWYYFVYLGSRGAILPTLLVTVLPFVLPELIKLSLAYIIYLKLSRFIRQTE